MRRPKLSKTGSSSGRRADDTRQNSIAISNSLGWFGIKLGPSQIFGFVLHSSFQFGIPFNKAIAEDCRASIYLSETGEHVGTLWWGLPDGNVSECVSIDSGKTANLIVFSRLLDDEEYFTYSPVSKDNAATKIPDQQHLFNGTKKFILKIGYSHGKQLELLVRMRRTYDGKLYFESAGGGHLF